MNPIPINLAVEDLLSEFVAKRLLRHSERPYALGVVYNRGGFGYLKKTAKGWNKAAQSLPFFLLTDLDKASCPLLLLSTWFAEGTHPNMIARVAVREIEAWLLADAEAFASYLGVGLAKIPTDPESLIDPKATLIELATTSPRSAIRRRLVPGKRSSAKQGPDYNACLGEFVELAWRPQIASLHSPSLSRTLSRLRSFAPTWNKKSEF